MKLKWRKKESVSQSVILKAVILSQAKASQVPIQAMEKDCIAEGEKPRRSEAVARRSFVSRPRSQQQDPSIQFTAHTHIHQERKRKQAGKDIPYVYIQIATARAA